MLSFLSLPAWPLEIDVVLGLRMVGVWVWPFVQLLWPDESEPPRPSARVVWVLAFVFAELVAPITFMIWREQKGAPRAIRGCREGGRRGHRSNHRSRPRLSGDVRGLRRVDPRACR